MSTVEDAVAATGNAVTSLTTSAGSTSGSNRFIFGASTTNGQNTDAFKYGGSGGTDLDEVGATGAFTFGLGDLSTWGKAPGPNGSNTAYAAFASTTFAAVGAIFLAGVDQVSPLGTEVAGPDNVFEGGPAAKPVSLTLTGLNPGQLVIGVLGVIDVAGAGVVSITAGADTTIEASALAPGVATGEQQASIAMLSGVADGSGDLTLNATITISVDGNFTGWQITAFPVNDAAAGGASVFNPMTGRGGGAAQPLAA